MKYFVLIYDRTQGQILALREFPSDDYAGAASFRLASQRHTWNESLDQDIILFQASSEEVLRKTHGSYFYTLKELFQDARESLEAS